MKDKKKWPKKKKKMPDSPKPKVQKKMEKKKSGETKVAKKKISLKQAIAHRKTLTKGTKEWNRTQNFINRSLGDSKRHSNKNALTEKQMAIAKKQKSKVLAEASVKKKTKKTRKALGKAVAHAKDTSVNKAIKTALKPRKKKKATKNRIASGR